MRSHASELVANPPEVILAEGTSVLAALREATRSIPIVFFGVSDPEGAGVVTDLARPGGNITGFAKLRTRDGRKMASDTEGDSAALNPYRCCQKSGGAFENKAKH